MHAFSFFPAALALVLLATSSSPSSQERPAEFSILPQPLDTGRFDGGRVRRTAFETDLRSPNAAWIKIVFDEVELGENSFLFLENLRDGDSQILDARSIADWDLKSGTFWGDAVRMQLDVEPGDTGVRVRVRALVVGKPVPSGGGVDCSDYGAGVCGADDRRLFEDRRIGRLFPARCTGWMITNGAFLTAGHCVDVDPDDDGPDQPDGAIDISEIHFNVNPSGQAAIADQYPILPGSIRWIDGGVGSDWAVFAVGKNSDLLLPHQVQGFPFRVAQGHPGHGATLRVTGYGFDNLPEGPGLCGANADSRMSQTATGTYDDEDSHGPGKFSHDYNVDQDKGNSGGPLIWEDYGVAMGIVTHANCRGNWPFVDEGNFATGFRTDSLRVALDSFSGDSTICVDGEYPLALLPSQDGTVFSPFRSMSQAIARVNSGGVLAIVSGSYPASAGNTFATAQAMRLTAPCGPVLIGN